ncbi:hypothetical protein BH24CHL7_BH24CHL7_07510 [soil metagenome]
MDPPPGVVSFCAAGYGAGRHTGLIENLTQTVRRNTLVLALAMALSWSVVALGASLVPPTTGVLFFLPELACAGYAVFLLFYGASGLVIGRAMDRWRRRSGLQVAFALGAAGALGLWVGVASQSILLALVGLLVLGLGNGGVNLARAAGADMHPPERRPRGIALVLLGAAFGAIGAPIVFSPLLAGARAGDAASISLPWLLAAGLMAAGMLLLLLIRHDPRDIAEHLRLTGSAAVPGQTGAATAARPVRELVRLPQVPFALVASIVAQAVMSSVMALAGLVLIGHGHDPSAVLVTLSFHFVGMFGLVLVVGRLVERLGGVTSVLAGLLVLAVGTLLLLPGAELINFIPGLFLVGVGWNIAYVAATTILSNAAATNERARLLGLSDFMAIAAAAALSAVLGVILAALGLAALALIGAALALFPAAAVFLMRGRLALPA